jgi:hypothetical protein
MRAKLFPFSFAGWVTLGFVSFLENCSPGGGGGGDLGLRNQMPGGGVPPAAAIEGAIAWGTEHWMLISFMVVLVALLSLLMFWLQARAAFVYIDNVAKGRFDLARPWGEHASAADSFFGLNLVIFGVWFIAVVTLIGLAVLGGLRAADAQSAASWAAFAFALLPFLLALAALMLLGLVAHTCLRDFVAPIQVSRGIGAWAAAGAFLSLAVAHPLTFVAYIILKFALRIAVAFAALLFGCLTCCIGWLPVLHHTTFQPVYYAERSWSLKLLAQMGDDLFPSGAGLPPPRSFGVPAVPSPIAPDSTPQVAPERTDFTTGG